ncbi:hypothetical protein H4S14_003076 [Agrobacterium vitis]|nr:hypothetical protein [Agrobacterium vitis]MBE1439313.1 hypothetical protein [Agrobacterium vitis]
MFYTFIVNLKAGIAPGLLRVCRPYFFCQLFTSSS